MDNDPAYMGMRYGWGQEVYFGLTTADRRHHTYIVGKTGTGKSTLLRNLIIQDMWADRGVGLIDPHGDLAHDLLECIPSHRTEDLVYFDPTDYEHPIGINLLEQVPRDERHLVASGIVSTLKNIWRDSWGPRMEWILRACVMALLECQNVSLLAIPRMLVDEPYRKWVLRQVKDPMIHTVWEGELAKMDKRQWQEAISPIQNKVGAFLLAAPVRNILGQITSKIDARYLMDHRRIFIANLSKGTLGEDNSDLLGAILVTMFQLAAMSRASMPEDRREDFHLIVDEFQNVSSDSFINILSEARKYRLALTLSHQHASQLREQIREAVYGNVGSIVSFGVGSSDAKVLSQEFGEDFTLSQFTQLGRFEVLAKVLEGGNTGFPFRGYTLPPLKARGGDRETLLRRSREKYAASRDEELRPDRTDQNKADAAALLAIARLQEKGLSEGIEYRFYTQTDVVREYCEFNPLGRHLMTKPGCDLGSERRCTDARVSAIRSSTYFALRTAFLGLAFGTSRFTEEEERERDMLAKAARSLLPQFRQDEEEGPEHFVISGQSAGIRLLNSVSNLRDRSFALQLFTHSKRRETLLDSIDRLANDLKGMSSLRDWLNKHDEELKQGLLKDVEILTQKISSTVTDRSITSYLLDVDVLDRKECVLAVKRWNAILQFSGNALQKAISGLMILSQPNSRQDAYNWVYKAVCGLHARKPLSEAYGEIVALLTVGESEAPLIFLGHQPTLREWSDRFSYYTLLCWAYSLMQSATDQMLQSWEKLKETLGQNDKSLPYPKCYQDLMMAWVSIYVSSALRDCDNSSTIVANFCQITADGTKFADAFITDPRNEEGMIEIAWAAKLFLLANEAWLTRDLLKLIVAIDECDRVIKTTPRLYLMNARFWAKYVALQYDTRQEVLAIKLSDLPRVAFEPFQLAVKRMLSLNQASSEELQVKSEVK